MTNTDKMAPVAWLVAKGRVFVNGAFVEQKHALNSAERRNDGAIVEPLHTAAQLEAARAEGRRAGLMEAYELCRDRQDYDEDAGMCAARIRALAAKEKSDV